MEFSTFETFGLRIFYVDQPGGAAGDLQLRLHGRCATDLHPGRTEGAKESCQRCDRRPVDLLEIREIYENRVVGGLDHHHGRGPLRRSSLLTTDQFPWATATEW
ncbi:MAG: hypothetical protein K1X38_02725 [Microthrixaceae bacterium]|nr:hypothetical protein [Microthrixaceae bacterium]